MVFLILAAQYERWSLPLAVLTAVPFAVLGALLAIWLRGLDNDVYFQIGLVTLIGLAAKNAILIVEFASQRHQQGRSVYDAAMEAARLRFRPIVMTSLAFILGVLPLAISTGAGSASRHSIGTGVIGGMLAATFVAILFVPLFFRLLTRQRKRKARRHGKPRRTRRLAVLGAQGTVGRALRFLRCGGGPPCASLLSSLVPALCAGLASSAWADKDKDKDKGHGRGHGPPGQTVVVPQPVRVIVPDRDRTTVYTYYRTEFGAGRCPPGLAKRAMAACPRARPKSSGPWVSRCRRRLSITPCRPSSCSNSRRCRRVTSMSASTTTCC